MKKILIVSLPIIVMAILMIIIASYLKIGINNEWVGFAGGLIGSFIGVFGVYWTMREDQKKREEERKEDFFIKNIGMYTDIIYLLDSKDLHTIYQTMNDLKKSKEWYEIEKITRVEIEKIIDKCRRSEVEEAESIARSYLIKSCGKILIVKTQRTLIDETSIETKDVFEEAIDELLGMWSGTLKDIIDYSLDIEDTLGNIEDFKRRISLTKYLAAYKHKSEEFYYAIVDFQESKEWLDYLDRRDIALNNINNLRKSLIDKIENLQ